MCPSAAGSVMVRRLVHFSLSCRSESSLGILLFKFILSLFYLTDSEDAKLAAALAAADDSGGEEAPSKAGVSACRLGNCFINGSSIHRKARRRPEVAVPGPPKAAAQLRQLRLGPIYQLALTRLPFCR